MQTPHYPNKRRKTQVQSSHPGFQGAPAISDPVDTSNMDIRGPARPSRTAPSSRRALYPPQNTTSRRGAHPTHQQMGALHLSAEETSPEDDLVERDTNGNYIIASPGGAPVPAEIKEMEHDIEEEKRLLEIYCKQGKEQCGYKQFADFPPGDELDNVKSLLERSLERKVQSLEHDRWIFEGDGKSKG